MREIGGLLHHLLSRRKWQSEKDQEWKERDEVRQAKDEASGVTSG